MPKTLIPAQRHRMIREYLEIHQIVRSSVLSEMLGASEATIRRDLEELERLGVVERAYGGAILSQRMPLEPAYSHSALAHPEEKRWIGRAAAAGKGRQSTVVHCLRSFRSHSTLGRHAGFERYRGHQQ